MSLKLLVSAMYFASYYAVDVFTSVSLLLFTATNIAVKSNSETDVVVCMLSYKILHSKSF